MGKFFGRNNKNRKSIFDTSDDKYNGADSYGFIKEEQLPEDRSIRRRKKITLFLTVVFSAALFGIIASVVFRITSGVLDSMDERKHTVDVRPDDSNKPSPTPGYGSFKEFGLYVFTKFDLVADEVNEIIGFMMDAQQSRPVHYDHLFISQIDTFFDCDLCRGDFDCYPIDSKLRRSFYYKSIGKKKTFKNNI